MKNKKIISLFLSFVMALGTLFSFASCGGEKAAEGYVEDILTIENPENDVKETLLIENVESQGIKINNLGGVQLFAGEGDIIGDIDNPEIEPSTNQTYIEQTLTATVSPDSLSAEDKKVDWTIELAEGEQPMGAISDYITLTTASDGANTVSVKCYKKFDCKFRIVCTARNGGLSASCLVRCEQTTADELLGTWVFNETIEEPMGANSTYAVHFLSNNKSFASLNFYSGRQATEISYIDSAANIVYDSSAVGWVNETYRTIEIIDTSTLTNRAEFTPWLKANAVKQTLSYYAMTISGLGNSDPSTVTFKASGNQMFPTTAFPTVTQNGNNFIKIPTMYRKVESVVDGQITSFTIANAKVTDSYAPYPCFVRSDGSIAPYVLIGKGSFGVCNRASGLEKCRAVGRGYYPYDIWTHKLFQDLELAMSKKVDYNDGSDVSTAQMGLEELCCQCWVFGVVHSDQALNVCYDPYKYVTFLRESGSIVSDYKQLSYYPLSDVGNISKLGFDSTHPFVNLPISTNGDNSPYDYSTYYCDKYYYGSGNLPIICSVGGIVEDGLWGCSTLDRSLEAGIRLCYRPFEIKRTFNFTIANNTYQAEEGMTWNEWIVSDYNTAGYKVINDIVRKTSNTYVSGVFVYESITENGIYSHMFTPGGGAH